jgi:hypothetical protein
MSEKDIIWSSRYTVSQSAIDIKKMLNVIGINGTEEKSPGGRGGNGSSSLI